MSSLKSLIVASLAVLSSAAGPAAVDLGLAGDFAILSKSGITDVPSSAITGNVGTSPITGAALLLSCPEVTGTIFTVDAAGPLACRVTDAPMLGAAVLDLGTAYTDAAGRTFPDFINLGAGEIGGQTLTPGLYKWGSGVLISTSVTLSGSEDDVYIFQISGNLIQATAKSVFLSGGLKAENIFWQVSGYVDIGVTAHFEGVILCATHIAMKTKASLNGRVLAQTAVTLQMNTITAPNAVVVTEAPVPVTEAPVPVTAAPFVATVMECPVCACEKVEEERPSSPGAEAPPGPPPAPSGASVPEEAPEAPEAPPVAIAAPRPGNKGSRRPGPGR